jgi:ADP-glucose pyrophosphorylase
MEITDRRAKPAVYFGGKSRIIDFALSNAMNSGIRRIAVATQYKAHSLIRKFGPATGENLADAIRRANALFHDKPVWRNMQKNGVAVDVSWANSARQYAELYRQIVCPP